MKSIKPQIQKAQQPSSSINRKKNTPVHIIIHWIKSGDKEKNLKTIILPFPI